MTANLQLPSRERKEPAPNEVEGMGHPSLCWTTRVSFQMLVHRLGHLKHVQFIGAEDGL